MYHVDCQGGGYLHVSCRLASDSLPLEISHHTGTKYTKDTRVLTCADLCVCVCMRACVRARARVFSCACVCVRVRVAGHALGEGATFK